MEENRKYRKIEDIAHTDGRRLSDVLQEHEIWLKRKNHQDIDWVNSIGNEIDLSGWNLSSSDLSNLNLWGVNLSKTYLSNCNLIGANLEMANLSEAHLWWADLSNANLTDANLSKIESKQTNYSGANFSGTNLDSANLESSNLARATLKATNLSKAFLAAVDLSGAKVDERTISTARTAVGGWKGKIRIGINGIYNPDTDSAALMRLEPKGDSMKAQNVASVLENLKRAEHLLGISLLILGISIVFWITGDIADLTIPLLGIKVPSSVFPLLASVIMAGILGLVQMFIHEAYEGAKYLNKREDVMQVASFPWALTKYTTRRIDKVMRYFYALHPCLLLIWLFLPQFFWPSFRSEFQWGNHLPVHILTFGFILASAGLSIYIWVLSERFQKPILFDTQTENARKSDAEKLLLKLDELKEALAKNQS